MPDGIRVLAVDERPSISRAGKPQNEVVLSVETDYDAIGQIVIPAAVYSQMSTDPEKLAEILIAKRDELNAPFMV